MFLCWKIKSKTVCIILVSLLLYNEHIVYWYHQQLWPSLPDNSDRSLIVLLVADPQIQGENFEPSFPIGNIRRWDADRFLKKTFELVYHYSRPHVVIFLGDLMDEGDHATDELYHAYYNRLMGIFHLAKQSKVVYIAGDNDIGGERFHKRFPAKVKRFEQYFQSNNGVTQISFLDIIKVFHLVYSKFDYMSYSKAGTLLYNTRNHTSAMRVIVTHETFLSGANIDKFQLIQDVKPNLIISAHMHKSMQYEARVKQGEIWVDSHDLNQINTFIRVNVNNPACINEIMVPTCSYRMGVPTVGYGVAVISEDKKVEYTVFWSPHRFHSLLMYACFVIVIFIYCIYSKLFQGLTICKRSVSYNKHYR